MAFDIRRHRSFVLLQKFFIFFRIRHQARVEAMVRLQPRLARWWEVGRTAPPGPELNRFSASVRSIVERDDMVSVALDVNGTLLYGEIGREQAMDEYFLPGVQVQVLLRLRSLHPFT